MARLFVAVWPSPAVRAALADLYRPGYPALRWTPAERWHVTLRFLGDVGEDHLEALNAALAAAVGPYLPCQAVVGPSTVRLGRSVLAVPVAGLDRLAEAVIERTRAIGEPRQDRCFSGHMTLARGRGGRPVPSGVAGVPVQAAWDVEVVTLVCSHLRSDGPRYNIVSETRGW